MSLSNTKGCITKAITKITELIDTGVPSLPNEDDDLEILEKAVMSRKVQLKQFHLKMESMEKHQDKLWRLFEKLEAAEKKNEKADVEDYANQSSDALSNAEDAVTTLEVEIVQLNCWIEKTWKTRRDSLLMNQSGLLNSQFSNRNALFNSPNTSPQLMDQSANSQNSLSSLNGLLLPKPQLPKFNGNLCQWITYWKSFKELVHNQNIGEAHKFQLLIDSLSGNALEGITEFRITKNYASAIAYLEERYGCEDTLINDLLNQLEKHRSRSEYINDQRNTLVKVKAICVQLIELGESAKNKTLMNQVITKFNNEIQEKVFTKREDISDWNLNSMLKTLESVITISERVNSRVNANLETSEMQHNRLIPHNPAVFEGRNTPNTQQQKKFCLYCPRSDHNSQDCPEISNPADRRKFLINNDRCLNCGRKNHLVTECRNTINCAKCNGRHHTSICDRNQSSNFDPGFKTGSNGNFTQIRDMEPPERNANTTETHMHSIAAKTTSDSSLKFGYLLSGSIEILNAETGKFEKATAAFDSMAETSFIHNRAVKRLKLKNPGEVTLDIHTFGSPTQPQSTKHSILDLHVRDQAGTIHKLTAAEHKTMINAIERPTLCKEDLEFLKAEQITVENTSKVQPKREVGILLGCDSIWPLMQEGLTIKQLPPGLHAIPTRFGNFLSGRRTAMPTQSVQIHSIQCIRPESDKDNPATTLDSPQRQITTSVVTTIVKILGRQLMNACGSFGNTKKSLARLQGDLNTVIEGNNANAVRSAKLCGLRRQVESMLITVSVAQSVHKNALETLNTLKADPSDDVRRMIDRFTSAAQRGGLDTNSIRSTIDEINSTSEIIRELTTAWNSSVNPTPSTPLDATNVPPKRKFVAVQSDVSARPNAKKPRITVPVSTNSSFLRCVDEHYKSLKDYLLRFKSEHQRMLQKVDRECCDAHNSNTFPRSLTRALSETAVGRIQTGRQSHRGETTTEPRGERRPKK